MLPRDVREALSDCEAVLSQLQDAMPLRGVAQNIRAAVAKARAVLAKDRRSREDLWSDDSIQFARLVAELAGMGLANEDRAELCGCMDLESEELQVLFQRAEVAWDQIKRQLMPQYNPQPERPAIRLSV